VLDIDYDTFLGESLTRRTLCHQRKTLSVRITCIGRVTDDGRPALLVALLLEQLANGTLIVDVCWSGDDLGDEFETWVDAKMGFVASKICAPTVKRDTASVADECR